MPLYAAFQEAKRLDHGHVSGAHVVLAILRGDDGGARRALEAAGVDAAAYEQRVAEAFAGDAGSDDGVRSSPAFHTVDGAARAFAAVAGREKPDALDALLAVLFDASGTAVGLLEIDEPVAAIWAALEAEGMALPPVRPPEHHRWRDGGTVVVPSELSQHLCAVLTERHPPSLTPGTRWGVAPRGGDQPVAFHFEEGVDIDAVLAEARRRAASA
jgi:hypothetical protein